MIVQSTLRAAVIMVSLTTACGFGIHGGDDDSRTTPTIVSITPTGSALTGIISITATFSEAMDPDSLTAETFTLTAATGSIAGAISYANSIVVFRPTVPLVDNTWFTATITTGASSMSGVALAARKSWSFTTGMPGVPLNLRSAINYVILAKGAVTTVPISAVTGDVAVSPAAASYITGFSLAADGSNTFSRSTQVTGKVFAADYAGPTPATLTTAVLDMEGAFTAAAVRPADVTGLGDGEIGGNTISGGVYHWNGALAMSDDVTLAGSATDVWIFQTGGDVTMTAAKRMQLTGGALAKNVFWTVEGSMTLGAGAHVEGVVLTRTYTTFGTGASITGRLLAQTAITIAGSAVVQPAP